MTEELLRVRGGQPLGKNCPERFVARSDELRTAFNRAKDRQRMQQEDPEFINAWFNLVRETIEK